MHIISYYSERTSAFTWQKLFEIYSTTLEKKTTEALWNSTNTIQYERLIQDTKLETNPLIHCRTLPAAYEKLKRDTKLETSPLKRCRTLSAAYSTRDLYKTLNGPHKHQTATKSLPTRLTTLEACS